MVRAKFLNKNQVKRIESLIEKFENATGAELLLVIGNASDTYPGAILRFAIFSSFILTSLACLIFEFKEVVYIPLLQLIITILMVFAGMLPILKKLSLSQTEMKREVSEKSLELFQLYGPTRSQHRVSIFLYVSSLEREIRILVDKEIKEKFSQSDLDLIIQIFQEDFSKNKFYDGFETAIETLEGKVLHYFPNKVLSIPPDNMNNQIIWVKN